MLNNNDVRSITEELVPWWLPYRVRTLHVAVNSNREACSALLAQA